MTESLPAITAINARLLDDYIADCEGVVAAWNKVIRKHGVDFELVLPHRAFNRRQGLFAGLNVSPSGDVLAPAEWEGRRDQFLASEEDLAYVLSLMKPVTTVGNVASWISLPKNGVGGKPGAFEYVRIAA